MTTQSNLGFLQTSIKSQLASRGIDVAQPSACGIGIGCFAQRTINPHPLSGRTRGDAARAIANC